MLFQSTPLMRGETGVTVQTSANAAFQSTPLMRGETVLVESIVAIVLISIHSHHARGDPLPDGRGFF